MRWMRWNRDQPVGEDMGSAEVDSPLAKRLVAGVVVGALYSSCLDGPLVEALLSGLTVQMPVRRPMSI